MASGNNRVTRTSNQLILMRVFFIICSMRKPRWVFLFVLMVSLATAWGCAPPPPEGYPIEVLQATAESSILETALALPTDTIQPVPTLKLTDTQDPNFTATFTATFTPTPTNTATLLPTSTPTPLPQVYVAGDTNCRTGPSNHYDWKTLVVSGQTATIVGESIDGYYWVIENPNGSGTCWLWKQYTTLVAPISRLPIFASPPTKTPTRTPTATSSPFARFQYSQVMTCDGQDALVIRVFNSSRRILDSWRVRLFTLPGKVLQLEVAERQFSESYDECKLKVDSLDYRQTAYIIVPFDSSTDSEFYVEVEACPAAGIERDCAYDVIKFNH